MAYEKFTLKYRPFTFDEVVGQKPIVNSMLGMLRRGKINRALLIPGPYGSGKTSLARLFATYLNCLGREKLDEPPCGECEVCKRMRTAPPCLSDYREINAGSERGIKDIRSLYDYSRFMPSARYRIFVLDEVHQLTADAFEAFLKLLEEPPSRTVFILCTTDPRKIPRPLMSRCAKYIVKPVPSEETVSLLQRVVKKEELDPVIFNDVMLARITVMAEGNPRDSVEMLEAVVNRVAGEGNFDPEKEDLDSFLIRISEESIENTPEKIAARFLLGVYSGKFTGSILVIQDVAEGYQIPFVNKVMDFHSETMCWRFSKEKLCTKMMVAWHAKLEENFGNPKESGFAAASLINVMDIFLATYTQLKMQLVDSNHALIAMAAKATAAMQKKDV